MMNFNKNYLQSPHAKSPAPYSRYLLKFDYSSRKKYKKKMNLASSVDRYPTDIQDLVSDTVHMPYQSEALEQTPKCYSISINKPPIQKIKKCLSPLSNESAFITQDFPQRKVKTNEHQLFKYLSKLQNSHSKQLKTEPVQQRNYINFRTQNHQIHTSLRPHLKLRLSPQWVKNRYCINRDKDHGYLPSSIRPSKVPLFSKMGQISVRNPFKMWK